jgi:hypothetical protein
MCTGQKKKKTKKKNGMKNRIDNERANATNGMQ